MAASAIPALGIPAVDYGPGDPNLVHTRGHRVPVSQIYLVERVLRGYSTS